ncbi:MAG: ribosomal-protein-alanine N-acetyltransferase [Colwellia sp.]|jgi:ribosomal-protein-alanine N-acetyltransferase|tara:strand:- start:29757 stop:30359 length:603 start_codon:yes stop_codon:yes gene_type:complete
MTKDEIIQISSDQLPLIYLQTINKKDANDEYVQWLNDPQVNQYLETRFYQQDLQSVSAFIANIIATPNEHLFTIRLKKTNKHIGNIKVGTINNHHSIGDISLFIGDKCSWGQGIAKQAIQLISRYSFEQLGLRKLCASAYIANIGSTKAFLNSGYINDGVLADHYTLDDQPCDLVKVCIFSHQINELPEISVTLHHCHTQ